MLNSHFGGRLGLAAGIGQVGVASGGLLGPVLRGACRLPRRSGGSTARLTIQPCVDGCEQWTRRFGRRTMNSTMRLVDHRMVESIGVLVLEFDIFDDEHTVSLQLARFGLGPVRLTGGRVLSIATTSHRTGVMLETDVNIKLFGGRLGWVCYRVTLMDCSLNYSARHRRTGATA